MFEFVQFVNNVSLIPRLIHSTYALPDKCREMRAVRYLDVRINAVTEAEDKSFVEWIQEGQISNF